MDDFIRFDCPSCGKNVKAKAEQAGKRVRCPRRTCSIVLVVPTPAGAGPTPHTAVEPATGRAPAADAPEETFEEERGPGTAFRQQSLALGLVWALKGLGYGLLAAVAFGGFLDDGAAMRRYGIIQAALFGCLAPVWLVVGVLTCLRRVAAIRVGLYLEYLILVPVVIIGIILMLAGTGLCLNIINVVITVILIRQAHRLLGWARKGKGLVTS